MIVRRSLIALVFLGSLSVAGSALADAVTDWNLITVQTVGAAAPPRPGPSGMLDFAKVHAAIYDAVQAIEGDFEPYAGPIPGATGSPEAAAAKAAHDVLVSLFPAQAGSLDTIYDDYLASHFLADDDPGVAVGQQAAANVIAFRAGDGSFPNPPLPAFFGFNEIGVWRSTTSYLPPPPPSGAPFAAEFLAYMTPYAIQSSSQFRPQGPPALNSGRYRKDYNEVKRLGGDVNSERTPEQTDTANFWNLNFGAQWQLAFRDIAAAHVDNISDSSRLFALITISMADAMITVWDSKRHFMLWRPVTAIQEGDNDGNKHTEGDVNWRPFINTPPYPDYSSGANGVSWAAMRALKLFFGTDHFTFVVTSNNPAAIPPTRTYTRFSDAGEEVLEARILQGIHFRFADEAGAKQGRKVASYVFKNFLRPVGGEALVVAEDEEEDED
jgi:hypothetical protein